MLPLELSRLSKSADIEIGNAFRLFQLGHYQWTLDALDRATIGEAERDDCSLLRQEAARYLHGSVATEPRKLVWQIASDCWESNWIRYLFAGSYSEEVEDHDHQFTSKRMIVADNVLTEEKAEYYKQACLSGSNIILVHLSDEGFRDDITSYQWCAHVYRNYWSRFLAHDDRITCFPIGTRTGIVANPAPTATSKRKWLWGFAGDVNKSNRMEMAAQMSSLAEGYTRFTSGFASSDGLSLEQYLSMLEQVAFAPCPSGNENIDTFRVYEALECGAVPIVERRHNHDYYFEMCGPHPLPTVSDWRETPHLLAQIGTGAELDRLQRRCIDWWSSVKLRFRAQIADDAASA